MSFGSLHLFLNSHSVFPVNHEKSDEDEVLLLKDYRTHHLRLNCDVYANGNCGQPGLVNKHRELSRRGAWHLV